MDSWVCNRLALTAERQLGVSFSRNTSVRLQVCIDPQTCITVPAFTCARASCVPEHHRAWYVNRKLEDYVNGALVITCTACARMLAYLESASSVVYAHSIRMLSIATACRASVLLAASSPICSKVKTRLSSPAAVSAAASVCCMTHE